MEGASCQGASVSLPISSVVVDSSSASLVLQFSSLTASLAVPRTVCVAGAGPATPFVAVPSISGLLFAEASSFLPSGLPVPIPISADFVLSGVNLGETDVVVWIPQPLVCVAVPSTSGVVAMNVVPEFSSSSSKVLRLVSGIDSDEGRLYSICIQYRGTGLFYGLSDANRNRFSAVGVSSIQPTQYMLSSVDYSVALRIVGAGMSSWDSFYAVFSNCTTETAISTITLSPSFDQMTADIILTASFSDGAGNSFVVCLQPGGNNDVSFVIPVGNGDVRGQLISVSSLMSVSPTVLPHLPRQTLTVHGSGFAVGDDTMVVKVSKFVSVVCVPIACPPHVCSFFF